MSFKDNPSLTILPSVLVAATAYGITFPLFSLQLEAWSTPGYLIGLNSAMPALGWLIGSFFLPRLQLHASTRTIMTFSALAAALVWCGFSLFADYWVWTGLRLLFGGAIGLFFRTIEFGLNAVAPEDSRGKTFARYNLAFGLGIAAGAAWQPLLGKMGPAPLLAVGLCLVLAAGLARSWHITAAEHISPPSFQAWRTVFYLTPVPLVIGFLYGFLEDIPAYLFSVYALRNGFEADIAAYTLTAAALGSVSVPVLLGRLADRGGLRLAVVLASAGVVVFMALLPFFTREAMLFLGGIFIASGFMSSLYMLALVLLGHGWSHKGLNTANAAFGASYAAGGLAGPLVNGAAIDTLNSHGLIVSAVLAGLLVLGVAALAGARHFFRGGEAVICSPAP